MALLVGALAPDFTRPGWYQQSVSEFTLSSQLGTPVVLAFYPGDDRLVCTKQLCQYSDNLADLHRFDAAVWGIAPQAVDSHREFAEGRRLTMPLLADVDREVARRFGVLGPLGLRRSVFVVDAGGRIAWRRIVALNLTFPSVWEIKAALADLKAAA